MLSRSQESSEKATPTIPPFQQTRDVKPVGTPAQIRAKGLDRAVVDAPVGPAGKRLQQLTVALHDAENTLVIDASLFQQ
jgi:hypothetical protein